MSSLQRAEISVGDLVPHGRRRDPIVVAALAIVGLLTASSVLAPLLAPHGPNTVNILNPLAGMSRVHPLGTDGSGRDILSRLIYGARPSLLGPALVVTTSLIGGLVITLTSVWFGGLIDELLSRLIDVLFAVPGLLLAIVAVAVFGPGLLVCVSALAVAYVPYMARIIRGPALNVRSQPFVAAYELQGFSGLRICIRQVLPAIRPFIFAQAAVGFGYALIDLAALSFLGLGVQPPTSDWGVMIADGETNILRGYPQEAFYAGLLVILAVVSVNIIGERFATSSKQRP